MSSLRSIEPLALPFDMAFSMPGSKSHANRAIVAACLAPGRSSLLNATPCEDVDAMVDNLARMGFDIRWRDGSEGVLDIDGGIPERAAGRSPYESESVVLDCGNAGTTLRFLTSIACLVPGSWTLTGNPRMRERPIGPLVAALRDLGADIRDCDGTPPVTIRGATLQGRKVRNVALDARMSSQFLSSLLLIAPALDADLDIEPQGRTASPTYVDLTHRVRADFAAAGSGARYEPRIDYAIEGDWSALGALLVLAELTGSRVRGTNLDEQSAQGDRRLAEIIAELRGRGDRSVDCTGMPDQLMNLAVLAAGRKARTHFVGARNLRTKECDRLAVVTSELSKLGIHITEHDDGVTVRGRHALQASVLDPHGDHRMAMAFAILGSMQPGIRILEPECVAKSYPGFFADLELLRRSPRAIAVVGDEQDGTRETAAALAQELGMPFRDGDAPAPGNVIATSRGSLTSPLEHLKLRDRATVLLLRQDVLQQPLDTRVATLAHDLRSRCRWHTADPGTEDGR